MTKEHDEKEPAFKVVDRRCFNELGEENAQSKHGDDKSESPKIAIDEPKANEPTLRPTLSFSLFIQSLGHQAMMGLGLVPWPDSGEARVELGLAKETIDILHMLKEKTAGNLSKDEEVLVTTLVYQLKMVYVEMSQLDSGAAGSSITER